MTIFSLLWLVHAHSASSRLMTGCYTSDGCCRIMVKEEKPGITLESLLQWESMRASIPQTTAVAIPTVATRDEDEVIGTDIDYDCVNTMTLEPRFQTEARQFSMRCDSEDYLERNVRKAESRRVIGVDRAGQLIRKEVYRMKGYCRVRAKQDDPRNEELRDLWENLFEAGTGNFQWYSYEEAVSRLLQEQRKEATAAASPVFPWFTISPKSSYESPPRWFHKTAAFMTHHCLDISV